MEKEDYFVAVLGISHKSFTSLSLVLFGSGFHSGITHWDVNSFFKYKQHVMRPYILSCFRKSLYRVDSHNQNLVFASYWLSRIVCFVH